MGNVGLVKLGDGAFILLEEEEIGIGRRRKESVGGVIVIEEGIL